MQNSSNIYLREQIGINQKRNNLYFSSPLHIEVIDVPQYSNLRFKFQIHSLGTAIGCRLDL